MTRTYLVVLEQTPDEAWSAFSPDVLGTGGMGDTRDEARRSLREGIGYMMDYFVEKSLPFPEPNNTVDFSQFTPDPSDTHYEIEWMTVDLPEVSAHVEDHAKQAA